MKKLHGWQTATLGEVSKIGGGSGFPDAYQGSPSGDIPFIKVSDLNLPGNEKYVISANNWVTDEVRRKLKAKVQPSGSIVFAKVGGAMLTNKRRILTRPTIVDNNMMALEAEGADQVYLYQFMLSVDLGRYRQEGAVPSVNGGRVAEIVIDLPPVPEQRKIADILTTWDEALTQLDALIEAQERRKKALMQQLLTGKRRVPAFDGKPWEKVRMGDVLKRVFRPIEWSAELPLSLVSLRRRCGGLFRRPDMLGADYKTQDLHELHADDFLISKRQVVHGAWGLVTPDFAGTHVSKEYAIFMNSAPKKLHMPFFAWLCQTPRMIRLARVASTGVHIEKLIFDPDVFLRDSIRIPSDIEEQRKIASILGTADKQLTLLRLQRTALDRQKRGLMQRLLTGKLRVSV